MQDDRTRARDRARYQRKREAGTLPRKVLTPEQAARKNLWRDVGRAFDRFMRLPPEVQTRVLACARSKP